MTTQPAEVIRKPLMSGHCASHSTHEELSEAQAASHQRCVNNGGGNRANPKREFQPCPCPYHYGTDAEDNPAEVYECGACGREIVEAWYWPLDEDGETRYTHIDGTGRALGEECTSAPVSRNFEPETESMGIDALDAEDAEDIEVLDDLDADEEPEPERVVYVPAEYDEVEAMLAEFDLDDD